MLGEGAHLLDSHAGVRQELDPDRTDVWACGIGVGGRGRIRVSDDHGIGGTSGELQ